MGRRPSARRIEKLWARRGSLDCMTEVGRPDPLLGRHRHGDLRHGSAPAVRRLAQQGIGTGDGFREVLGCECVFGAGVRPRELQRARSSCSKPTRATTAIASRSFGPSSTAGAWEQPRNCASSSVAWRARSCGCASCARAAHRGERSDLQPSRSGFLGIGASRSGKAATLFGSGRRRRPRGSSLGSRSQRFGSAIASRIVRGPSAAKEFCMSTQSFADLGVSRAVLGSLSQTGVHSAVRDPARRDRRRPRRPRRAREIPHRLGQDARLRNPARRADRG